MKKIILSEYEVVKSQSKEVKEKLMMSKLVWLKLRLQNLDISLFDDTRGERVPVIIANSLEVLFLLEKIYWTYPHVSRLNLI